MTPSLLGRDSRLFSSPWSAIRYNTSSADPRKWETSRRATDSRKTCIQIRPTTDSCPFRELRLLQWLLGSNSSKELRAPWLTTNPDVKHSLLPRYVACLRAM